MKIIYLLFVLFCLSVDSLAQTVISQFDFNNAANLTSATVGPNGISTNPNAALIGGNAGLSGACGSTRGIDLKVDAASVFSGKTSFCMETRFQFSEVKANFFDMGKNDVSTGFQLVTPFKFSIE